MTYVFDIDGTICENFIKYEGLGYRDAKPYLNRIKEINRLYDEGHTIIMFTARGMGRSRNNQHAAYSLFYKLTVEQLKTWKVKYHELFLGKPAGDFYIDDKGLRDEDFFGDKVCP